MKKIVYDNIIFSIQKYGGITKYFDELIRSGLIRGHNIGYMKLPFLRSLDKRWMNLAPSEYSVGVRSKNWDVIYHSTYFMPYQGITVHTVHDLMLEKGIATSKYSLLLLELKKRSYKNASKLICVSQNTKNDLLNYYPDIDESKVEVIYNGYSQLEITNKFDLPFVSKSYFIFIGSRAVYKRFNFATEACKKLGVPLVIVGGGQLTQTEKVDLYGTIYFHQLSATDDVIQILLKNALGLLYPSSYEGFGIPVLESVMLDVPVVAFNTSSISEIFTNTDYPLAKNYVSPVKSLNSFVSLANLIVEDGIDLNKARHKLRDYSWNNTVTKTLDLYGRM